MALIDQIIDITITRETVGLTRSVFGTILIMGESDVLAASTFAEGEVKEYNSLSEVAEDFATDTAEYEKSAKIFAQEIKVDKLLIARQGIDDADYTSMFNRLVNENDNFYAVIATGATGADLVALAQAVETSKKILAIGELSLAEPANINALSPLNLSRSVFMDTRVPATVVNEQSKEASWFGRMIPTTPGSNTWANKNLNATSTAEYTTSEITTLQANNVNYYVSLGGRGNTLNGVTLSGEYIDVIVGLDWLEFFMQSNVLAVFQTNPKVPYTNQGINLIENAIRASMDQAVENGIVNAGYTVTTPDSADVSASDKATRILRNVTVTAVLTGAIHRTEININISL